MEEEAPPGFERQISQELHDPHSDMNQCFLEMMIELQKEVQALKQDREGSSEEHEGAIPFAPHILAPKIQIETKAQVLADFIVETNEEESPEQIPQVWRVYVDGSTSNGSGGAGIVFKLAL